MISVGQNIAVLQIVKKTRASVDPSTLGRKTLYKLASLKCCYTAHARPSASVRAFTLFCLQSSLLAACAMLAKKAEDVTRGEQRRRGGESFSLLSPSRPCLPCAFSYLFTLNMRSKLSTICVSRCVSLLHFSFSTMSGNIISVFPQRFIIHRRRSHPAVLSGPFFASKCVTSRVTQRSPFLQKVKLYLRGKVFLVGNELYPSVGRTRTRTAISVAWWPMWRVQRLANISRKSVMPSV